MFLAIGDHRFDVLHRVSGQDAGSHDVADAFFDGRHEVAGDGAAEDLADELKLLLFQRLDAHVDFGKLPSAAGLLLVAVLGITVLGDGLPVRHTRLFRIQASLELGFGLADGYVDVLPPHTLEDGLVCAGLLVPGQGHIFFAQAGQGGANLGGIRLSLGGDRNAVEGAGVFRDGKFKGMAAVTKRIPSRSGP